MSDDCGPGESSSGVLLRRIIVADLSDGGVVRHAAAVRERTRALRDDCLASLPPAVRPLLPLLDAVARGWLRRSTSPYLGEIEAIAAAVAIPGVWFLNGSYQWGCTALVRDEDAAPWLVRTLDWPFTGLGRHLDLVRMAGPAGDFYSATWPGYVGTLTAMAPGRFAAAMNQAPLRRRTRHPWLRLLDIALNAMHTFVRVRHMPPDQLLRLAFETCRDVAAARALLERTPVARPVIFTLAGCTPGERFVIERTEEDFSTRTVDTCVANDWLQGRPGWEARISADLVLRCSTDAAAENSRTRRAALAAWTGRLPQDAFAWVVPPVLNPCTRLAVEMCPARGILRAVGYEPVPGEAMPQPVTEVGEVRAAGAPASAPV